MSRAAEGAAAFPLPITDPAHESDAPRNALERRMAAGWLRDPRDLAFLRLCARAALTLAPLLVLVWIVPPAAVIVLGPLYLGVLYLRFGGPLMLMVHALAHRPAFRGPGRPLEALLRHGIPVLYGISPFAYRAHHVLMHHREENRAGDASSTRRFRRDSPAHFVAYVLRFLLIGNIDLALHLLRAGQHRALTLFVAGEAAFLGAAALLLWIAPAPALATLAAPYVLTRFFLMAGNWAQHAFIDPEDPDDGVRNATVLLNASHNHRCFNDGYHALHHRLPSLHWAEMSRRFAADWRDYARDRVLVFSGIANNQVVWWRLMRGDHAWLAARLVDTGWLPQGIEARTELLRMRAGFRPVATAARSPSLPAGTGRPAARR